MIHKDNVNEYLQSGSVIRFYIDHWKCFDDAKDSDEYERKHYQGVVTQKLPNGVCSVMYQESGDILPKTELCNLKQITHILVPVHQK